MLGGLKLDMTSPLWEEEEARYLRPDTNDDNVDCLAIYPGYHGKTTLILSNIPVADQKGKQTCVSMHQLVRV